MSLEREANRLAESYLRIFLSRFRYRLFSLKNVKETKWWSSFFKTASFFSQEKEWDPYKYVSFVFDINEKPLPFVLVNKGMWQSYKEHCQTRTNDKDNIVAKSLLTTFNEIKDWSLKNKYDTISVEKFFKDPKNFLFLKRGKFSPYFLATSRSFIKMYNTLGKEEREQIITEDDLMIKRLTVTNNKKISNKLKEVLGEEFIDFN